MGNKNHKLGNIIVHFEILQKVEKKKFWRVILYHGNPKHLVGIYYIVPKFSGFMINNSLLKPLCSKENYHTQIL